MIRIVFYAPYPEIFSDIRRTFKMANFNFNKVILAGRLTADPELRQTAQGIPVSFAEGLPAAEKDAFMLFTDILDWLRNDCSHDFLTKLIRNRAIEFRVSDNKNIAPLSKREVINYFSSIGYIYEFASYERIARGVREQKADAGFLENGGEDEIACNDPRVLRLTEITAKE